MTQLHKRNVLITGAAQGIGKCMAEMIAARGGQLILCDINQERLEETAQLLRGRGARVWAKPLDISDREAVYRCAREVQDETGGVDVLINNAGIVFTGEILDLPDEKHHSQVEVNLMGTLWMLKAFVPPMVARDQGHIVNVASSAGLLAMPGMGMYSATKFALVGLNEALRVELANRHSHIKTTLICPYIINTGMFEGMRTPPLQPPLTPDDMAQAVIDAILSNRTIVAKPFTAFIPPIIKALLGPRAMDFILRLTGLNTAIYHCKGFYRP